VVPELLRGADVALIVLETHSDPVAGRLTVAYDNPRSGWIDADNAAPA
jgi:hypothetical protein